jgi:hypothetical protein
VLWAAALILAAATMGMTLAHVLELPPSMSYGPRLWTRLNHTFFQYFASIGGPCEVVTVIILIVLAAAARRERSIRWPAVTAAACFAAALIIWLAVVQPANAQVASWTTHSIPSDWKTWRDQWEYGHAARFVLMLAGYIALVVAVLRRGPAANRDGLPG